MTVREELLALAEERLIILDGAMGTMIQKLALTEGDFRGGRFANHPKPLAGMNDVLCLTQPRLIAEIHSQYLEAGADIIESCSFNANAFSLADYGLSALAREISREAVKIARGAASAFEKKAGGRHFVAGVMGPTTKSGSISPDVNDSAARDVSWDELVSAYMENAAGLLEGGADIILVETIFDTLNAKAAIFAARQCFKDFDLGDDAPPLWLSATVSGLSGRILAGQNVEAFAASVLHADPLILGLNCSFGPELLAPFVERLSAVSPCLVSVHPNAGLPVAGNPAEDLSYDETPKMMAAHLQGLAEGGIVNILGGCCGSTPEHIRARAD
jgi:5-methyltetrahydrofolate--homocysteine methyltransferase